MTHPQSMIRPAWTPATIALMVLGFMIFWPLGLAMLAYILWGDRLDDLKGGVDRAADSISRKSSRNCGRKRYDRSGNVAFDDWREEELTRLREERRKIDEMIKEFENYQTEKRRSKDSEEFDDFMKTRKRKPAPRSSKASAKKIEE